MKKINVAILFGGRSGEHEVSLTSAKNIISALDKEKYDIFLIGIDKEGRWHYQNKANFLLNETNPKLISLNKSNEEVFPVLSPEKKGVIHFKDGSVVREKIDVVIPVLHGPFGEDGTVQGLLEVANLPYVGSDTIGSSVGMDKDVMKRLLQQAGIPIPKFITFNHVQFKNNEISFNKIKESLGLPFFVKPVNLGSSVGISKVSSEKTFEKSVQEAFQYDLKIIFEENIVGREIEVAILGNYDPKASIPGEIIPKHDFYSYEAKYIDEDGAKLEAPAKLTDDQVKRVQKLAIKVFKVLEAKGLSRVDFFLNKKDEFICNEINTFPGFTKISMYPKLWELSGIKYSELLDKLIELAFERAQLKNSLRV